MKLTKYILKINGFDFTRGCISETEHPFTDGISPNDARITTHIYENMFFSNIFSSAHEGGHAIYEQNLNNKLPDNLRNAASMAWHESQSRFYENIICRSEEYIHLIYKKVNQVLPKPYKNNVSEHDMYLAANKVEPSLVRTEADELTYTLHIIIRYELEKQLIDGKLQVKDLRNAWNKLYKEYLGVDVTSDKEGVLQDSHWSSEAIGYFPSYALGNAYGAQILHTMMKDFDVYEAIKENKIKQKIGKWLKDHIYVYGEKLTPQELILKVTGEPLNPKYFEDYLTKKYTKIYKL
jgi:carboxypeptidase Taq